MNTQQRLVVRFFHHRREAISLLVLWLLSIILGITVAYLAGDTYLIAESAAKTYPDLVLLYIVNALPIFLLAATLVIRSYGLVCSVVFLYGLFRGFCGMSIIFAFGSSGWLVRCLLLFSCSAVSVLMWWLILFCYNRKCYVFKLVLGLVLFVSLVTFVDYFVISPFLSGIF